MKKRFKGLIALIMAMTMVVSTATSAFAAISDEDYDLRGERNVCMEIYLISAKEFENQLEENGTVDLSNYYEHSVSLGDNPAECAENYYEYYTFNNFTIYEVKEDGMVHSDSKKKEIGRNYVVTEEDIKEYGSVSDNGDYYFPCLIPDFIPRNYTLDVYDETGTTKVSEITYNIESDKGTEELVIPEGYIGYMLYSESEVIEYEDVYDEEGEFLESKPYVAEVLKSDVFISSYSDLVREMTLSKEFYQEYEFKKLIPTKKMPYKINYTYNEEMYENAANNEGGMAGANADYPIVWLEPGEKIIDNPDVKKALKHCEYDENQEIEWTVWTVWYCGGSVKTHSDQISTGLDCEDYSDTRIPGDYHIYYYEENYPILATCLPAKEYTIPYYEMDGTRGEDLTISEEVLDWDFGCECTPLSDCYCFDYLEEYEDYKCYCIFEKNELAGRYQNDNCPDGWKFEYDGHNYGELRSLSAIWNAVIANGNYDSTKAKFVAVCKNHEYDYENGKVVVNPTVNEKGTTEYSCTRCGATKTEKNVDKLIAIDSVTLSNTTYTYNGKEQKPTVTVKAYVDSQLVTLTNDNYTVSYKNNKNAGTATVTVTGKGKFGGTKTSTFKINPAKITSLKLNVKNQYTGKTIKGTVVVKAGNTKLTEGKDYTVSYKNNIKIGTARVTVTGKGNYTGTLKENFTIQPKKVTGLKQSGNATNSITLKWNKVAGAKGYIIYLENTKTGKQKSVGESTANSFTVKNLKAGTNYKYAVRAYGLVGKVRVHGAVSATKTMMTKTAATKVTVTGNSKKKAVITWNKVTGAEGYEVYMSTKKNSGYTKISTASKNTVKYTKSGLTSNKTYYFKVRSYKTNESGKKVYSEFSSVKSVKVK
ncbi:MAG: fibronectin type III domain-containing protein [Lachnospiraceae bacterium]|nr:fibronectin type III domain-containing protein [Lachnospiraceae bacterium]